MLVIFSSQKTSHRALPWTPSPPRMNHFLLHVNQKRAQQSQTNLESKNFFKLHTNCNTEHICHFISRIRKAPLRSRIIPAKSPLSPKHIDFLAVLGILSSFSSILDEISFRNGVTPKERRSGLSVEHLDCLSGEMNEIFLCNNNNQWFFVQSFKGALQTDLFVQGVWATRGPVVVYHMASLTVPEELLIH